jgi:hypothetical protein
MMPQRQCGCGAWYQPQTWSQKRCNICRFAPSPNPRAKLSETDIPVIRRRYFVEGHTAGRIARDYGMARSTIYAVVQEQTWQAKMPREWRDIPGYDGLYRISNYGKIHSLRKKRLLHPQKTDEGYRVILRDAQGRKSIHAVHRLLLMAFQPIDNPRLYRAIPHNDNKHDLRLDNWQWVPACGEHGGNTKLSLQDVKAIKARLFADGTLSYRALAEEYNVDASTIGRIMAGDIWKHAS